jgi:hypothetical protein
MHYVEIEISDETMFGLLKAALQDGVELDQYVAAILKGVAELEDVPEPDDGGADKIKADLEAEELKRRQTIEVGDTVLIKKDNSHGRGRGKVGLVIDNPWTGCSYPYMVQYGPLARPGGDQELYRASELTLLQKGDRNSGAVEGDRN